MIVRTHDSRTLMMFSDNRTDATELTESDLNGLIYGEDATSGYDMSADAPDLDASEAQMQKERVMRVVDFVHRNTPYPMPPRSDYSMLLYLESIILQRSSDKARQARSVCNYLSKRWAVAATNMMNLEHLTDLPVNCRLEFDVKGQCYDGCRIQGSKVIFGGSINDSRSMNEYIDSRVGLFLQESVVYADVHGNEYELSRIVISPKEKIIRFVF